MNTTTWHYLSDKTPADFNDWREILLHNRGLKTKSEQAQFFAAQGALTIKLDEVNLDKTQVKKAALRILQAVAAKENILIFGDYDVDGNTATAVMWQTLDFLGVKARPFIPHRVKHGYGMNERSLEAVRLLDFKPDLIVSVDNGVVAHETIAQFIADGAQVIVTDHHEAEVDDTGAPFYPKCSAVVHTTDLCGAGVAWFLCRELLLTAAKKTAATDSGEQLSASEDFLRSLLPLVALGTVVDQVPLLNTNRDLVKSGLAMLKGTFMDLYGPTGTNKDQQGPKVHKSTKEPCLPSGRSLKVHKSHAYRQAGPSVKIKLNIGLQELIKISDLDPGEITEDDFGFKIGPRINAIGRLENTLDGVRLLCTKSPKTAHNLAAVLHETNTRRQELTTQLFDEAVAQVDAENLPKIIIVQSEAFHEGIIGLIASKLVDKFYRPTIAVAITDGVAKGSVRSVEGVNIIEILRAARTHLSELGGHSMAAGFSATAANLPLFVKDLEQVAKDKIDNKLLTPRLVLENNLALSLLADNAHTLALLDDFAPFGSHNEQVIIATTGKIVKTYPLGAEGKHLKFLLKDEASDTIISILQWRANELEALPQVDEIWQVALRLGSDTWQGEKRLKLVACAWQPAK